MKTVSKVLKTADQDSLDRACQGDRKGNYDLEHDRQFCGKILTEENEALGPAGKPTGFCKDCWQKAFPQDIEQLEHKICPRCGRSSKDVPWYPFTRFCKECIVNHREKLKKQRRLELRQKLGLVIKRVRKKKPVPTCVLCGLESFHRKHWIKSHRSYHEFKAGVRGSSQAQP